MSWFLSENLKDFGNFLHGEKGEFAQKPIALTIGNFDGVHFGHQELISRAVHWAREHSGYSVVLTFSPHPLEVLGLKHSHRRHLRIFSFDDQHEQIKRLGVDGLFIQKFDEEFAALSATAFMDEIVVKSFNPKFITVGYDFSFGRNREGTIEFLKNYCLKNKIEFEVVPALKIKNEIVSSSLIRKKIEQSLVAEVPDYLGRPFYLEGVVTQGDRRGSQIGFPTANMKCETALFPGQGVYVTRVLIENTLYDSITNVGTNPTFLDDNKIKIETHILNFDKDIYEKKIRVFFLKYLRGEKKFSGIEELVRQIKTDIDDAKAVLNDNKNS